MKYLFIKMAFIVSLTVLTQVKVCPEVKIRLNIAKFLNLIECSHLNAGITSIDLLFFRSVDYKYLLGLDLELCYKQGVMDVGSNM